MDNNLLEFMRSRFPVGSRIKIDHADDESMTGKTFNINSVEADGLHCSDESSSTIIIDPEQATFYKLDQPPVIAYGYSGEPAELTDVRQIAEFIMKNGMYGDITMYDKDSGEFVLNTMGTFIDRIADMDFRSELMTILVPLQQEYPFGMPKEQEEEKASDTDKNKVDYNGTKVYFEISDYCSEPSVMALSLFTVDDNELYTTLSVNLPEHDPLKPNQTFIDTNNCFGAEAFLESLNGAKKVTVNGIPVTGRSGYCTYPLYEFDEELLCELDAAGYEEHLKNCMSAAQETEADEMEMGGLS